MPSTSAGLLLYRYRPERSVPEHHGGPAGGDRPAIEVLLVHPGGPYWARRDDGWWSIPKGEVEPDESPLTAAHREVAEELGVAVAGTPAPLGEVVQGGGKRVVAWALRAEDVVLDAAGASTFDLEWPPRSGRVQSFPEVDRAEWFDAAGARRKLLASQLPFLERLEAALSAGWPAAPPTSGGEAS